MDRGVGDNFQFNIHDFFFQMVRNFLLCFFDSESTIGIMNIDTIGKFYRKLKMFTEIKDSQNEAPHTLFLNNRFNRTCTTVRLSDRNE